jgi:Ca-activated chloride channel homolog
MKRLALLLVLLLPVPALAEVGFTSSLRANRNTASANGNYHRGQYEQARAGYLRAKDLTGENEPEVADLHFNIGATFYKDGNYAEAEKEFQIAAGATDPVLRQEALYNLGNVAFQAGMKARDIEKLKKAADYYQQALALNPNDEDARFNLEVVRRNIKLQQKQQQQQPPQSQPNQNQKQKPGDQNQQNQQGQQNQQQQGQQQQGQQQQQGEQNQKNQQGQQQQGQQQQGQQQQQPGQQNQQNQNPKTKQQQQQQQAGQPGQSQPKPAGQGEDEKKKGNQPQPAAGSTAEPKPKKPGQQAQPVQPAGSTERQGKLTKEEAARILQAVEQQEQEDLKRVMQAPVGSQRSREKDW